MSSQVNYAGTYLADHPDGRTHDNVRRFLNTQRFTPRQRWPQVRPEVVLSTRGDVLSGDAVLDKHHSRRIELVRRQYSGNARGVRAGTGPVTCVSVNPETDQFWLIAYRRSAPEADGKTKLAHVAEVLAQRPRAALPTARSCWTVGAPPRSCSSGCSPKARRFTAR